MSARTEHLAQVLSELEPQVDSGRLAIGLINEKFAATRGKHQSISSPRAMACLIRAAGLTVSRSRRYVNGRHGAYCMIWDSKTEAFTKQSSQSSQSSQTNAWRALAGENIKNQCSQSSQVRGYGENFENIENQCSHPEPGVVEPHENIENVENMDSSTNPKAESADNGEPATENWVDDLERLEAVAYDKTPEPATCLGCKHLSEACFCSVKKEHRFTRQTGCDKYGRREGCRDRGGEAIIDF